jgi:hypothetical protein
VASGDGWGNSGSANGSRAESFDHDDSTWASFASNSINSKSNSGSSSSTTGAGGGIPTNSHVDWVADLGFGDSSDGLSLMETNVAAGVDGAMPLFPAGSTMFSSELIDSHVPTNALFPERSSEFPSSSAPKRMKTSHAKAHNATSNNKAGAGAKMVNMPGNNKITIQSGSSLFSVSRSGASVTFEGTDGTIFKIPATKTAQTIVFDDKNFTLKIEAGSVMLDSQMIGTTRTSL